MSDTFKLTYYNSNGRGLLIRAILYTSKSKFEDIKITEKEFEELKKTGKVEFGQLPILEYKDKIYSQSHAIEMYLSKIFGFRGKTNEEEFELLSLLDSFDDFFTVISLCIFPKTEDDKNRNVEYKQSFYDKLSYFLRIYEKKYIDNGEGNYFFGNYFSLADIYLCSVINYYSTLMKCEDLVNEFGGKLVNLINKIKNNELKEFFEKGFIKNAEY